MKRFARILASSALKFSLVSLAISAALVGVLGSSSNIKKTLTDTNIYSGFIKNSIKSASDKSVISDRQDIPLGDDAIQQAAETALPPDVLQSTAEQVIDGVYRWLDGEVAVPDFHIDLTKAKQRFVTAAGDATEARVESLPVCTTSELKSIDVNADVFSLACRPTFLSASAARNKIETDISTNEEFLKDPILSVDTLPKNEQGNNAFQQAKEVPKAFQKVKLAPWVLGGLSLVLGTIIVFLSPTRRKGVKSLAVTLLSTGGVLLLSTWLFNFGFKQLAGPQGVVGKSVANDLQASILQVVRSLTSAFSSTLVIYSLVYLGVGIITLLGLRFLWRTHKIEPNIDQTSLPQAVAR